MGKLEKVLKNIPKQMKKMTPQKTWTYLLHIYCSVMITIGAYNVQVTTENLLNPIELKDINIHEIKKDVKESIEAWKNKTYSFKEYHKNKKEVPYTFQDYSKNKKSSKD